MKILIVEDEVVLRDGLVDLLEGAGHDVDFVGDGATAVKRGLGDGLDLVLLDVMLPKLDGIAVCQRLRQARPELPILMLTAKGSEEDKVRGLKCGADDYITKPFGARELLARVDAVARRMKVAPGNSEMLTADGCTFDLGRLEARRGQRTITLTPREAGILRWLYRHRARAISREELLEQIWGLRSNTETRTVDMTIANLRAKVERDTTLPRIVVSVKGIGYAWGAK